MEPSPAQLRALLLIVCVALAVVIAVVVRLVRSGRAVQFPDVGATNPSRRQHRGDRVSIV